MKGIALGCGLIALANLVLADAARAEPQIEINNAWARATPGASSIGAAYLQIANRGDAPDRLVSVTSFVARAVELHSTVQDGNVMRMQRLDAIELAPGAKVDLAPGGMHLMLIDLKGPLRQGNSFALTLTFSESGATTVEVTVQSAGASGMEIPAHHH
jgi:copper(I)-binding protein